MSLFEVVGLLEIGSLAEATINLTSADERQKTVSTLFHIVESICDKKAD
jgi:hypothetical protein